MPCVYILFSRDKKLFYIGSTSLSAEARLARHLTKYYDNKFTAISDDWELFNVKF